MPYLRSQINPGAILRLVFTQITTLQAAGARQSARKAKKRPKWPLPTTRTHGRNQATAHHYRRQLPHLRSLINPDTILRDTATFIANLQTAGARKSARKAKKRPKSPLPTTRTPRPEPSHGGEAGAKIISIASLNYRTNFFSTAPLLLPFNKCMPIDMPIMPLVPHPGKKNPGGPSGGSKKTHSRPMPPFN